MKNKKVLLNMAGKIIFILSGKVVRCLAAFDESRVVVFWASAILKKALSLLLIKNR